MKTVVSILAAALLLGALLSADNLPRGRVTARNVAGLETAGLFDRAGAALVLATADQELHDFLVVKVVVLRWGGSTALAVAWPYTRQYRVYNID